MAIPRRMSVNESIRLTTRDRIDNLYMRPRSEGERQVAERPALILSIGSPWLQRFVCCVWWEVVFAYLALLRVRTSAFICTEQERFF